MAKKVNGLADIISAGDAKSFIRDGEFFHTPTIEIELVPGEWDAYVLKGLIGYRCEITIKPLEKYPQRKEKPKTPDTDTDRPPWAGSRQAFYSWSDPW